MALQALLPVEFSRHEYCSGLTCPTPGDLPDPGIEPASPEVRFFTAEPPSKPSFNPSKWETRGWSQDVLTPESLPLSTISLITWVKTRMWSLLNTAQIFPPGGSEREQTTAGGWLHTQDRLQSGRDSVLALEGKDALSWIEREEGACLIWMIMQAKAWEWQRVEWHSPGRQDCREPLEEVFREA